MDRALYEACVEAWEDAAFGDSGWAEPLELTEKAFGATGVILHVLDRIDTAHTDVMLASRGIAAEAVEKLTAHYIAHDIRAAYAKRARSHEVITDHHLGRLADVDKSTIYAELYRPYDYGRCAAVRVDGVRRLGIGEPSRVAFFNVLRANNSDAPDAEFQRCTLEMARTVQRSLRVATSLDALRAANAAKSNSLDHAAFAAIFMRSPDTILDANATARRHFDAQDALSSMHGKLSIHDASSRAAFQSAMMRVAHCGSRIELCAIKRKELQPLGMMIVPAPPVRSSGLIDTPWRADAIVMIFDPDVELTGPTELWRAMFGFTEAEATVAQLLVNGLEVSEIAERRMVSAETVRSQFKRIYAKLGVDSQASALLKLTQCAPRIEK